MTITIAPETEALLRVRAAREEREVSQLADALLTRVLLEDAGRDTEMKPQRPVFLTSDELFADIEAADPL